MLDTSLGFLLGIESDEIEIRRREEKRRDRRESEGRE